MLDLAADWPLYALNTSAAAQLFAMGARHVTLSPEDGLDNMRELLKKLGERAVVVVYQDTPLYIAETCPVASLNGECSGPSRCPFKELEMVSNAGEHVIAANEAGAQLWQVAIDQQHWLGDGVSDEALAHVLLA